MTTFATWIATSARIQLRREEGQTMTEYGVLLALIAVGVIAVLLFLGPAIAGRVPVRPRRHRL